MLDNIAKLRLMLLGRKTASAATGFEQIDSLAKLAVDAITRQKINKINSYACQTPQTKLAGATWRTPENLAKILRQAWGSSSPVVGDMTQGFNRNQVLQAISDRFGMGKTIAKGYQDFTDKLNWRPLPEKIQNSVLKTIFDQATPKYIFRGTTPGKNINNPFAVDNAGLAANFVHGSPSPFISDYYAKQFGGGRAFQMFKPTRAQGYMPDFRAQYYIDKNTGTLKEDIKNRTWAKISPDFKTNMSTEDFLHPGMLNKEELAHKAIGQTVYETPVMPANKVFGTFLARRKSRQYHPGVQNFDYMPSFPRARASDILKYTEIASVPNHLNNKFVQMSLEKQRKLPTDSSGRLLASPIPKPPIAAPPIAAPPIAAPPIPKPPNAAPPIAAPPIAAHAPNTLGTAGDYPVPPTGFLASMQQYLLSFMGGGVKQGSTAWVRAFRAGKLSPESLGRIAARLPEGTNRFVRPLGKGINMQADLMVGNLGGQVGQVVRKLPIHAIPPKALAAEAGNLQLAQTIISKLLKGSNK